MPDVIFMMTKKASAEMNEKCFKLLADAVSKAVADVLELVSPDEVAVYELVANRTRNVKPIQVLCIANVNPHRLGELHRLKVAIAAAIQSVDIDPDCADLFENWGKAESWPLMPAGSWQEVVLK